MAVAVCGWLGTVGELAVNRWVASELGGGWLASSLIPTRLALSAGWLVSWLASQLSFAGLYLLASIAAGY